VADVTIQRCTLRIVRHGGWSWGPEPRKLLQSAVSALPELLERELSKLWEDDVECEIAAPLKIAIPISIVELIAASEIAPHAELTYASSTTMQTISSRIGTAARQALGLGHEQIDPELAEAAANNSGITPSRPGRSHAVEIEAAINSRMAPARATPSHAVEIEAAINSRMAPARATPSHAVEVEAAINSRMAPARATPSHAVEAEAAINSRMAPARATPSHAVEVEAAINSRMAPANATPPSHAVEAEEEIFPESSPGTAVLQVLLSWRSSEQLIQRLADFSPAALEAWHARLLTIEDFRIGVPSVPGETIRMLVEQSAQLLPPVVGNRAATLRRRIAVLAEVMARLNLLTCPPLLRSIVDQTFPLAHLIVESTTAVQIEQPVSQKEVTCTDAIDAEPNLPPSFPELPEVEKAFERVLTPYPPPRDQRGDVSELVKTKIDRDSPAVETHGPHSMKLHQESQTPEVEIRRGVAPAAEIQQESRNLLRWRPLSSGVRHVASALPFLLLGPLSRMGYCKTLAATMDAANASNQLPLFATALAYKVLAPPARGWRRDATTVDAAMAFAALDEPAIEPALVQMADSLSDQLSPLDSLLSGALIAGHDPLKPLLIFRSNANAEGYLLLDSEGVFPIKWTAEPEGLLTTLIKLEPSLALIPQAAAETKLLKWFNEQGFRFITDARPTRGDEWRALRRPPDDRWWTNDMIASDTLLVRMARMMRTAAEDAEMLWQSFAIDRPSVPLADDAEFDRHLTFVAAIALGTIAWELWREREPTAPHLALERFRDLDAQVCYSRDTVRVTLPLGRRFQDLRVGWLLDDVDDVPWFNGRSVIFSGG